MVLVVIEKSKWYRIFDIFLKLNKYIFLKSNKYSRNWLLDQHNHMKLLHVIELISFLACGVISTSISHIYNIKQNEQANGFVPGPYLKY